MTENVFDGIPLQKLSVFKKEAADFQNRVSGVLPGANAYANEVNFSVYPKTTANHPIYSSTGDAICIIRFAFNEHQYSYYAQAVQEGKFRLTIKTYPYPTYPIIQFVIRIYSPNHEEPWWSEILGDITDGDFRDFITDAYQNRKWKLVIARYDPYQEQIQNQMIDKHEKEVTLSEQEVNWIYEQGKTAAAHYQRIPPSQHNFLQAAKQFMADNLPIEGIG